MTEIQTLTQRIDALEIHIAHQDRTIEDLNAAITDQWKQIEDLAYRLSRLADERYRSRELARRNPGLGTRA